jgi:HlyD family secretion protein
VGLRPGWLASPEPLSAFLGTSQEQPSKRTGLSYFTIRIGMTAEDIARLGDVKLAPGMPVEAFVQTGERTMISYLMKPLHDQLMRAFRER